MSDPFLAEIKMVGFNFAPRGWAFCDGQVLPINQNQSLFSLLGTTYGGDGRTSFNLPELRGRSPRHVGDTVNLGQSGGSEEEVLTVATMPSHRHTFHVNTENANAITPIGNYLGQDVDILTYHTPGAVTPVNMEAGDLGSFGGGQSHQNMQPFIALNFCIALQGVFPSRN